MPVGIWRYNVTPSMYPIYDAGAILKALAMLGTRVLQAENATEPLKFSTYHFEGAGRLDYVADTHCMVLRLTALALYDILHDIAAKTLSACGITSSNADAQAYLYTEPDCPYVVVIQLQNGRTATAATPA